MRCHSDGTSTLRWRTPVVAVATPSPPPFSIRRPSPVTAAAAAPAVVVGWLSSWWPPASWLALRPLAASHRSTYSNYSKTWAYTTRFTKIVSNTLNAIEQECLLRTIEVANGQMLRPKVASNWVAYNYHCKSNCKYCNEPQRTYTEC